MAWKARDFIDSEIIKASSPMSPMSYVSWCASVEWMFGHVVRDVFGPLLRFFRGVKLFVPSCVVEGIRLQAGLGASQRGPFCTQSQALVHHRRIADLFRNSGVAWDRRLNCQAERLAWILLTGGNIVQAFVF